MKREDPLYHAVGEKIRLARKERGFSQLQMSKAVDVSRVTIAMYELGRVGVPISNLYKIAAFLECEVLELMPPKPPKPVVVSPAEQQKNDQFHALLIQRLGGVR